MMEQFAIFILGHASERRTEAEILWRSEKTEEVMAVVYDTSDGWVTQIENAALVDSAGPDFELAVKKARERLGLYLNRRGENIPSDLSPEGLSLWLLEKEDGISMGVH